MTRLIVCAVFAFAIGGAAAARDAGPAPAAASAPAGQELFVANCASCHGISARGDGPVAEALRVRPPDLTRLAAKNGGMFPAARTRRIIDGRDVGAHGSPDMPVWGVAFKRSRETTDAEVSSRIDALVRYLETIQQRTAE